MSTRDATPSGDDAVAIPKRLLRLLRDTAERDLERACDQAFAPDMRDAVIDAVHVLDAFVVAGKLPRGIALALIPGAIDFEDPVRCSRPSKESRRSRGDWRRCARSSGCAIGWEALLRPSAASPCSRTALTGIAARPTHPSGREEFARRQAAGGNRLMRYERVPSMEFDGAGT
jgi:hypothetical protein